MADPANASDANDLHAAALRRVAAHEALETHGIVVLRGYNFSADELEALAAVVQTFDYAKQTAKP